MNLSRPVFGLFLIFAVAAVLPRVALAGHGFEIRPAKVEVALAAGEETGRELLVTNHTDTPARLSVSLEDFAAGPYSLLPYLTLARRSTDLAPGESVTIPLLISLPEDLTTAGLYGAVIVSFTADRSAAASEMVRAVSRLGALVFVRVAGAPVKTSGELVGFGLLGQRFVRRGEPIIFHIDYANRGNIYLNPYGLLTVADRFREAKFSQEINPWFVLPSSSRLREIILTAPAAAGLYRARLALNRGYDDLVDEASVTFIVWSWFTVGLASLIVLLLFMLVWLIWGKIKKP